MSRTATPARPAPASPPAPRAAADPTLDDALARVRELSVRLWAVRTAHGAVQTRLGRWRCPTCGTTAPCATLLAATGSPEDEQPARAS